MARVSVAGAGKAVTGEPAALRSSRGMPSPANGGLLLLPGDCPGTGAARGGVNVTSLGWSSDILLFGMFGNEEE